jgi:hypothetical protein
MEINFEPTLEQATPLTAGQQQLLELIIKKCAITELLIG